MGSLTPCLAAIMQVPFLSECALVHMHYAGAEPVAELIEDDGCDESADDVYEVMSLDVYGGAAEEKVEGQGDVEIRMAVFPKQNHQDGTCTDVR